MQLSRQACGQGLGGCHGGGVVGRGCSCSAGRHGGWGDRGRLAQRPQALGQGRVVEVGGLQAGDVLGLQAIGAGGTCGGAAQVLEAGKAQRPPGVGRRRQAVGRAEFEQLRQPGLAVQGHRYGAIAVDQLARRPRVELGGQWQAVEQVHAQVIERAHACRQMIQRAKCQRVVQTRQRDRGSLIEGRLRPRVEPAVCSRPASCSATAESRLRPVGTGCWQVASR